MTVTATVFDSSSRQLAMGSGSTEIVPGKTADLQVTFGGVDLGADFSLVDTGLDLNAEFATTNDLTASDGAPMDGSVSDLAWPGLTWSPETTPAIAKANTLLALWGSGSTKRLCRRRRA
jgi:hypothetical protein